MTLPDELRPEELRLRLRLRLLGARLREGLRLGLGVRRALSMAAAA